MKGSRVDSFRASLPWIALGIVFASALSWVLIAKGPAWIKLEGALSAAIVTTCGLAEVIFTAKKLRGYRGTEAGSGILVFLHLTGWFAILGGVASAFINPYG